MDLAPDSPPLGDGVFEGDRGVLTVAASGDVLLNNEIVWCNTVTTGYRGDSVRATCEHFVDCLRAGAAFETSGRDYLHLFAAVEAAYISAAERRAVTVAEVAQKL